MGDKAAEMLDLYQRLQDVVFSINGEESEHLDEASLMIAGSVCLMRHILEKQDRTMYSQLMVVLSDFAHRENAEIAERN
jgi:hypothetical protein